MLLLLIGGSGPGSSEFPRPNPESGWTEIIGYNDKDISGRSYYRFHSGSGDASQYLIDYGKSMFAAIVALSGVDESLPLVESKVHGKDTSDGNEGDSEARPVFAEDGGMVLAAFFYDDRVKGAKVLTSGFTTLLALEPVSAEAMVVGAMTYSGSGEDVGPIVAGGGAFTEGVGEEVAMSLSFRTSGGEISPSPFPPPPPPPPPPPGPAPGPTDDQGSIPDGLVNYVILFIADGLRGDFLDKSGLNTPNFDRLLSEGTCTTQARPDFLSTQTLPNHISMCIGEPVSDHGFANDRDPGGVIEDVIGNEYDNIFELVKDRGGSTAFYGNKEKFDIFHRSWNIDRWVNDRYPSRSDRYKSGEDFIDDFTARMKSNHYTFSIFHHRDPDKAGHANRGAGHDDYKTAVQASDSYLGKIFNMIDNDSSLRGRTAVILTSDHGR